MHFFALTFAACPFSRLLEATLDLKNGNEWHIFGRIAQRGEGGGVGNHRRRDFDLIYRETLADAANVWPIIN